MFIVLHLKANSDTLIIPLNRQYFHDKITQEQKRCDMMDGKLDGIMFSSDDQSLNAVFTNALYKKVDDLRAWIESADGSNNDKIRNLANIENVLAKYRLLVKSKQITGRNFHDLITALESYLLLPDSSKQFIDFIQDKSYEVAKIFTDVFAGSAFIDAAKKIVYVKYCYLHSSDIITSIHEYPDESFTDSLIVLAAIKNPAQIYTYAQSGNTIESQLIFRNNHPIVKTIAALSSMPNALLYFPFLDDLMTGKKTIDQISQLIGQNEEAFDSIGYYKMLVKTEIDYYRRMLVSEKDTPVAMFGPNGLRETLNDRAIRHFISSINLLHEQTNLDIRMRATDKLSATELYYMMVLGENEIYTSSFKHSFNRMIQRLGTKPRTDSLLLDIRFDFFKKFIKMCASYNKLDTFLKCMPIVNSQMLMKEFVANLDKSSSLEDATDVADSYSSINNKQIRKSIINNIIINESRSISDNNQKGILIYGILKNIFLAEDTSNHIDLIQTTGIASIYEIDNKSIQDDSGRIIEQVFFYGDEDGKHFFPLFINSFSPKEWKVIQFPEWVEIRSLKNKVIIFANKPLDYDANLDDSAQFRLMDYLQEMNLVPKIVVHRGHSYWLPGTISRMPDDTKIMLIGSCGGYKNLNKILAFSPNAHIISTKEIGAGDINKPILNYLHQSFIHGKKIIWKDMWKYLNGIFIKESSRSIKESWESYIPPYKNLGAIFLKVYNKKMASTSGRG